MKSEMKPEKVNAKGPPLRPGELDDDVNERAEANEKAHVDTGWRGRT